MNKIFKEKKYLVVAIAIVIMFAIYSVRIYFRHQIKKNAINYNTGIHIIEKERNYKKAIEKFLICLESEPNDPAVNNSIGYCYYMLGNFNDAINYFNKAIEIDPLYFHSLDYLALTYIEIGQSKAYNKAMDLLNRSRKTLKVNEDLWSRLKEMHSEIRAWIYFKSGYIEESLKIYKKIIPIYNKFFREDLNEFDECFADIHYHFGIIHNHNKDYSKAKIEFEKAIRAGGPQNIFTKRSKTELENLKKHQ